MQHITIGRAKDTTSWVLQVWASFIISTTAATVGILYLETDAWQKAFVGIGLLYAVTSSFTLAKTLRDQQESQRLTTRVDEARVEKLLTEVHPLK
ncbi:MAG: YiaA/YiaB family inner membrane protein [Cyanobacteriota bacterium]|nr:YiaA/YiaB family inner membrane protein [Cyanobacteriota bacterium]